MSDTRDLGRTAWGNVDSTPETAARYLALMMRLLNGIKGRTFELMELKPGMAALDVGCGAGNDAETMMARVGPSGRVVGIDASQELIAQAMARTSALAPALRFQVDDAQALSFPDDSFDAARVDRVLQHLEDPVQAVAEMTRVVKTGGRIAALEPDWNSITLGGADYAVNLAVVRHKVQFDTRNATIGRELHRLLVEAGCRDVTTETGGVIFGTLQLANTVMSLRHNLDGAVARSWITPPQAEAWWSRLEELDRTGRFFASMTGVLAGGTVT
ncbi:MAG TPA: methyltransferase domain-containing protein [Reyranella sp.]|nr:methyltransferase domain-containing protein [Reyranella sp.]